MARKREVSEKKSKAVRKKAKKGKASKNRVDMLMPMSVTSLTITYVPSTTNYAASVSVELVFNPMYETVTSVTVVISGPGGFSYTGALTRDGSTNRWIAPNIRPGQFIGGNPYAFEVTAKYDYVARNLTSAASATKIAGATRTKS